MNKTKKTKNKTLAIQAAVPAIPAKPNTPAIIATIKNMTAQLSIILSSIESIIYNDSYCLIEL